MKRNAKNGYSFAFFGLIVGLSGCALDTFVKPTTADISAQPSFLCGGETTTITWDAGEQFVEDERCAERFAGTIGATGRYDNCVLVNLTSVPAGLIASPVDPLVSQGSATSSSIVGDSTFTVNANVEDYMDEHGEVSLAGTTSVTVLDTGEDILEREFNGTCLGSTATWDRLDMKKEISPCVSITRVCNTSEDVISIVDQNTGVSVSPLAAGECTGEFNGTRPLLVASIIGFVPLPDMCGSTSTARPPRSISVSTAVECDRELDSCGL